jgi:hypothetical protein
MSNEDHHEGQEPDHQAGPHWRRYGGRIEREKDAGGPRREDAEEGADDGDAHGIAVAASMEEAAPGDDGSLDEDAAGTEESPHGESAEEGITERRRQHHSHGDLR